MHGTGDAAALLPFVTLTPMRTALALRLIVPSLWLGLLVAQTFLLRPPLNARSDVVIAGGDPGPSALHYLYIAADVLIVVLLAVWLVRAVRALPLRGPLDP